MITLFYKDHLDKLSETFLFINFTLLIAKLIIKLTSINLPKQKQN